MRRPILAVLTTILIISTLYGCAGRKTFTTDALAGSTIVLPVGWLPELSRSNVSITTTPCIPDCNNPTVIGISYPAGDARIRAVVGMQPDSIANVIVKTELNSSILGTLIESSSATNGDKEYLQTMILMDLPDHTQLGPGPTKVEVADAAGAIIKKLRINILPGTTGMPNGLEAYGYSAVDEDLHAMERADHYAVEFTGSSVPAAIQLTLSRPPGSQGVGNTYPVTPRSDIKHLTWNDDGTDLTVMILPSSPSRLPQTLKHYRFYVAGSPLADLSVAGIETFDINGNTVSGITAQLTRY